MVEVRLNKQPDRFDKEHRDKLVEAFWRAIMELSVTESAIGRVLHVRSAEITDAMGMVLAMIAASHKDAMTPRERRLLAEETTKRLFRRIDEVRKADKPSGFPFTFTTYDDDPTH